jgi:hypothetical protein
LGFDDFTTYRTYRNTNEFPMKNFGNKTLRISTAQKEIWPAMEMDNL